MAKVIHTNLPPFLQFCPISASFDIGIMWCHNWKVQHFPVNAETPYELIYKCQCCHSLKQSIIAVLKVKW